MANRLKKGYLQWRCRRGTKELDVVLNRFLECQYDKLTDEDLEEFDDLLNTQDTILWYWLIGKDQPESKQQREIIELINKQIDV
ncbi:MAG TPA: succinate dehydrogenase assembly factor 2 [Oceanospirillales bacterium]|nr:succinate dehydrogenase assembly factor 2 [Oceanospirillales bacterium]